MYFPEVPTCDSRQGADSPIQDFGDGTWGLRAGVPLFTRPSEEDGLAAVTGAFRELSRLLHPDKRSWLGRKISGDKLARADALFATAQEAYDGLETV